MGIIITTLFTLTNRVTNFLKRIKTSVVAFAYDCVALVSELIYLVLDDSFKETMTKEQIMAELELNRKHQGLK